MLLQLMPLFEPLSVERAALLVLGRGAGDACVYINQECL